MPYMITNNKLICPNCGGVLKYYDTVRRVVRTKNGVSNHISLKRFRCTRCGHVHRKLPNYILPYKQYELEIIKGVLEGLITPEVLGFEDYPCEVTMKRWKSTLNLHTV